MNSPVAVCDGNQLILLQYPKSLMCVTNSWPPGLCLGFACNQEQSRQRLGSLWFCVQMPRGWRFCGFSPIWLAVSYAASQKSAWNTKAHWVRFELAMRLHPGILGISMGRVGPTLFSPELDGFVCLRINDSRFVALQCWLKR